MPANYRGVLTVAGVFLSFFITVFLWIPVDAAASANEAWTPWPTWSAGVAQDFGLQARDFDLDDRNRELLDQIHGDDDDDQDEDEAIANHRLSQ